MRKALANGVFVDKSREGVPSPGYALHTLEVVWASFTTAGFESGVAPPANLDDDADIIAAAYGGLAGAWYAHAGLSRDFHPRPGR